MASLVYPQTLSNQNLNPAWMEFQFFERKSPKTSKPSDTIQLYMPESASMPNTVTWDTEKFGIIGDTIRLSAGAGSVDAGAIWSQAGKIASRAGEQATANLMAHLASRLGGNVSAEGLMGATSGKIPNPYLTMVFRAVDFRNYAFSFKFFPFTESDSEVIDQILKTFRANSLPPGKQDDAFLGYPMEVEVAYKWKADDNKYLHRFKRSVITGIDVDYTPNGMFAVMRNGMPACIQMNIKLSEIELVMRDDVKDGY